jgi:hypothetical protein
VVTGWGRGQHPGAGVDHHEANPAAQARGAAAVTVAVRGGGVLGGLAAQFADVLVGQAAGDLGVHRHSPSWSFPAAAARSGGRIVRGGR